MCEKHTLLSPQRRFWGFSSFSVLTLRPPTPGSSDPSGNQGESLTTGVPRDQPGPAQGSCSATMLMWLRRTPGCFFLGRGVSELQSKRTKRKRLTGFLVPPEWIHPASEAAAAITRMKRGRGDGGSRRGGGVWGRRRNNNGPRYLCLEQEAEQWLRDGGGPSHPWGEVKTPPPTLWPLPRTHASPSPPDGRAWRRRTHLHCPGLAQVPCSGLQPCRQTAAAATWRKRKRAAVSFRQNSCHFRRL